MNNIEMPREGGAAKEKRAREDSGKMGWMLSDEGRIEVPRMDSHGVRYGWMKNKNSRDSRRDYFSSFW